MHSLWASADSLFLHVILDFVLVPLCWGVPGVQFDFPQLDLLVPGATTVLPELIGSLWVNTWLTHVSANKKGKNTKEAEKLKSEVRLRICFIT